MPSQSSFLSCVRPAVSLFLVLTVVTGVAYPLAVTGVGQGAVSRRRRKAAWCAAMEARSWARA